MLISNYLFLDLLSFICSNIFFVIVIMTVLLTIPCYLRIPISHQDSNLECILCKDVTKFEPFQSY